MIVFRPVSGSTRSSVTSAEVSVDVGLELSLRRVFAGLDERRLPPAVEEDGHREVLRGLELLRELLVRVLVRRIRQRTLGEELLGRGALVGAVDAEERDLLAALGRHLLEDGELRAARPAPGCPLVDDRGMSREGGDAFVERGRAAAEDRARPVVERGERRWRPLQLALGRLQIELLGGG